MWFLTGFQNRLSYCYFYILKVVHIVAMMFVRKPTRPSFIDKAGCTQQFESELSLRCSFAQLFPVKSSLSSSMVFTPPSVPPFPGDRNLKEEEETALLGARNRYAIRLADHQRSRQRGCAGWDRMGFLSHRTINKLYFI